MKKLVKTIVTAAFLLAITATGAWAQTVDEPIQDQAQLRDGSGAGIQNQGGNSEFRASLLATFTEEQLAILENTEMTRAEKQEALHATFTAEQLALLDSHQFMQSEYRFQNGNASTDGEMTQVRNRARQQAENVGTEEASQIKQQVKARAGNMQPGEAGQLGQEAQQHAGEAMNGNGYGNGGGK